MVSANKSPTLKSVVAALRKFHDKPAPPVSEDPFELVLWEQVAYLVDDARRRAAFEALRTRVGLSPKKLLAAPIAQLRAITRLGGAIAAPLRAERLRKSAELVTKKWDGDLRNALALPEAKALKALAQFPMIGAPGAAKILAACGGGTELPLDSNALRVVQRLGIATEEKDYKTSYRTAQAAVAKQLPKLPAARVEAGQLLRHHGQTLCKRNDPDCGRCPLRKECRLGRIRTA